MLRKAKSFFLVITLLLSQACNSVNVIFDLGGVLIDNNKSYMMRQVGFFSFFMYLVKLNNPFALRTRFFSVMDNIEAISQNELGAGDEHGKPLPNIMCDWLAGLKTTQEIRDQINTYIENNPDKFHNEAEKSTIQKMLSIMFTPKTFANATTVIKSGLKFAKECKELGHKLFILSNWDRESALHLIEKHPELFSLFDEENIIISGEIGLIKPDHQIYDYILYNNNLKPEECIFFDDQEANINSAIDCGIHGVVCKNATYKYMKNELDYFIQTLEPIKEDINSEAATDIPA